MILSDSIIISANTLRDRIWTGYQEEFKEELDITLEDLTIFWKREAR